MTYRIAQLDDVESVYSYELKKTTSATDNEYDQMMAVWNSSFRKESLEHYFKLGWSFLALDSQQNVKGFFLGQPLLFFDLQTQSLWIEHVSAINESIATELIEIAYRLAREKHFQRVLISENIKELNLTKDFPFQKWPRSIQFLKTTK